MSQRCVRVTNQREAILCALQDGGHPTAAEIAQAVQERLPRTGRATVYRNLERLCDEGQVRKVPSTGPARFELMDEEHDHFTCTGCGRIIDIHLAEPHKQALKELKKAHPGLNAKDALITITGDCDKCNG